MKDKKYTSEELLMKWRSLSDKDKVHVLWQALDLMQAYNGRSRWDCTFFAMGYDTNDYVTWFEK